MTEIFGELTHKDDYITAVMVRDVDTNPAGVWPMLAEESNRVKWLAPGTIDLFVGGRAILDFKDSYVMVDSEVTSCEVEKSLGFSWSNKDEPLRPVQFEIAPTAEGSRITLTVSIPRSEVVARSCAGWESHLTMLQAAIAGVAIKFPLDRFNACREDFQKQLVGITMRESPLVRL